MSLPISRRKFLPLEYVQLRQFGLLHSWTIQTRIRIDSIQLHSYGSMNLTNRANVSHKTHSIQFSDLEFFQNLIWFKSWVVSFPFSIQFNSNRILSWKIVNSIEFGQWIELNWSIFESNRSALILRFRISFHFKWYERNKINEMNTSFYQWFSNRWQSVAFALILHHPYFFILRLITLW